MNAGLGGRPYPEDIPRADIANDDQCRAFTATLGSVSEY
jgi:hypothetical protein